MSHEFPPPGTSRAALVHVVSGEHVLWTVTVLAFAPDMLTTLYGLDRGPVEFNPVVLALIPMSRPVGVLISLKLVVLAVAVVV